MEIREAVVTRSDDKGKRMLERSPCGKQIYRKIESTG
jgi:hypothetical protein